jgi:hypothetical protein
MSHEAQAAPGYSLAAVADNRAVRKRPASSAYDFEFRGLQLVPAVKASASRSRLFAPGSQHHIPAGVLNGAARWLAPSPSASAPPLIRAPPALPQALLAACCFFASTTGLPIPDRGPEDIMRTVDTSYFHQLSHGSWRLPDDVVLQSGMPAVRVMGCVLCAMTAPRRGGRAVVFCLCFCRCCCRRCCFQGWF